MSELVEVRIHPELNRRAENIAKNEGKTLNELIRDVLEEYIISRDPEYYVEKTCDDPIPYHD